LPPVPLPTQVPPVPPLPNSQSSQP
jgi:hypothetical protein